MLSYVELRKVGAILELELSGATIHRIVQADDFSLAVEFRKSTGDLIVLLTCRQDLARMSVLPEMPKAPPTTFTFGQYLRAHILRSRFRGLELAPSNRQVSLRVEADETIHELILSILGARSNIYVLDSQRGLLHSLRPLEETRRELVLGGAWRDPEGSLPSEGTDRWPDLSGRAYLEELEHAYRRLERARRVEALSRKIENALAKEAGFLARKAGNLLEDLGEAREALQHRRRGELLKSALHAVKPGDKSASVSDFVTGETISIPLDPALTPAENLESYFRRYRKELRSVTAIEQQMAAVHKAQSDIESLQTELRALLSASEPPLDALQSLADRPRVRQLLNRHFPILKTKSQPKSTAGKREIPGRLRPKRYRTVSGLEIWVGRSDEGNDYLTTRLARGNDLFFHLEAYPGSHVVLRTEGRPDPPPESVLEACELAVHFSRLKEVARADVHMARIKDVRKPKGAKPGLVYVTRGRTIHLRRDPKRLEDILASRLDE